MDRIYITSLKFVLNDSDVSIEYKSLLINTNRDSLIPWRLKKMTIFMFKCYYKSHPDYLNKLTTKKSSSHELHDRNIVQVKRFQTMQYGY